MSDAACTPVSYGTIRCAAVVRLVGGAILVWSPRTPWSPRYVDADSATVRTADGLGGRRP